MFALKKAIFTSVSVLTLSIFLVVASQDLQIFPGAFSSLKGAESERRPAPDGFESFFIKTSDGNKLNVWRLGASYSSQYQNLALGEKYKAAIIFHGYNGSMHGFTGIQEWFRDMGIVSYAFDYRGFGLSSGWPSETGLYRDGEAVWGEVMRREGRIAPEEVVVLGVSLGTAPAAKLARDHTVGALVLVSPYTSLQDVVRAKPLLKYLAPLVWYKFPTREYVLQLENTCTILTHGMRDKIIPFSHSKSIIEASRGKVKLLTELSQEADHQDLFHIVKPKLAQLLKRCQEQE